jgi:hypothetical protein
MNRQTGGQTEDHYKLMAKQRDGQIERRTDREMDRQRDGQTERLTYKEMDTQRDGLT